MGLECLDKTFSKQYNKNRHLGRCELPDGLRTKLTQREAAVQEVKVIGLNQIKEINFSIFSALPQYRETFEVRMELLKVLQYTE